MLFLSMRSVFLLLCCSFLEEGVFSYIALATMLISFLFIAVSSFLLTTVVGRWIELIEQANVLIFHSCSFRRRVWRVCPPWWAWPSLPSLRLFPIPFRPSMSPRRDSVPWLWPLPWVLWLSMYISLVEIEGIDWYWYRSSLLHYCLQQWIGLRSFRCSRSIQLQYHLYVYWYEFILSNHS